MGIFDVDNDQQMIRSTSARDLLGAPSSATWAKWRSIIGARGRRWLTCRELVLLMVLRRFTARQIKSRIDAYSHAEILLRRNPHTAKLYSIAGDAPLPPRAVPAAIEFATGRSLSICTIRRYARAAAVEFSLMADIPAADVRKICQTIAEKRTKRRKPR